MGDYRGDIKEDSTIGKVFTTNDSVGGVVAPSSAFEAADYKIYKNTIDAGNLKATTNGVTVKNANTGTHQVIIDTSNDTGDSGFWTPGNDYFVVLDPDETVDSQTIEAATFDFSIENRNNNVALRTSIDTVETADSVFDLVAGSSDDDAYNNMVISIKDVSTGDERSRRITDYDGTNKRVTVDYDFEFAIAAGDIVKIWADTYSQTAGAATVSEIADAVWDEAQDEHMTVGTTGLKQHHSGRGRYGA